MNLDKVTVNIRPRTPWEAIDIGFQLAKRWYLQLLGIWLFSVLPFLSITLVISYVIPGKTAVWALLIFWLLKPLYEPAILRWISQALFGVESSVRETVKGARAELSIRNLLSIFFLRFSLFRSFTLPVIILEKLKGKDKRARLSLLRQNAEVSVFLTFAGTFIEFAFTYSLMMLLFWFIPEELRWVKFEEFIFTPESWVLLFSYIIACGLFAPFYISAGFMMYISRRVKLEAWDIEIGFKRMGQRLEKRRNGLGKIVSTLLFCSLVSFSYTPHFSHASTLEPKAAKESITKVLQEPEFGKTVTKTHWVLKEKKKEKEKEYAWMKYFEKFFESLSIYFEKASPGVNLFWKFAIICLAGAVIGFLVIKYSRIKGWLDSYLSPLNNKYIAPEAMFGMDLRPESLPDDIGAVCIDLFKRGQKREALSLLYRGTLSNLINGEQLEIQASLTEKECCLEVRNKRPGNEALFFDELTSVWIKLAYGHRDPQDDVCHELLRQWQKLYVGDE